MILTDIETKPAKYPTPEMFARAKTEFFGKAAAAGLDTEPADAWTRAAFFFTQAAAAKYYPDRFERPKIGICFYGPVGAGKTVLAEFLRARIKELGWRLPKVQTASLIARYREDQLLDDDARGMPDEDLFLDDLGFEEDGRRFGDRWGIGDFLKFRHEYAFLRHGHYTIATTNLQPLEQIKERYGPQIASRAAEMFDFVLVHRKDRRREHAERRAAEIDAICCTTR